MRQGTFVEGMIYICEVHKDIVEQNNSAVSVRKQMVALCIVDVHELCCIYMNMIQ